MESSPLILAHDHARNASIATQSSDTTVAINEHALAAGEFSRAAAGTGSAEALRTLRLLEQHHQRLSELLRYPSENPVSNASPEGEVQTTSEKTLSTSAAVAELRASKSDLGPRPSSPHRPPGLGPRRLPPRDLSSSIASNLASARGIRGKYTRPPPLSPSVSTHQAPGSLETHRRRTLPTSIPEHSAPSWIPPTSTHKAEPKTSTSRTSVAAEPTQPTAHDEGFSKFYSAFENILYKLSAPLAFAGLPLVTEDGTKSPEAEAPTKKTTRARQGSDPDLTQYISKAALRAAGRTGDDSVYEIVQRTGGTTSYAKIMSFDAKEKRRLASSMHSDMAEEDDDFVDASETPMPASPARSRQSSTLGRESGKKKANERELENKVEELGMENKELKQTLDRLARRLQAFEMSAQRSTLALQESMRFVRDNSPARERESSNVGGGGSGASAAEELKRRVLELEEREAGSGKEIERLGRENEKLKTVVQRYRERWEKLKEGAKSRREGTSAGTSPKIEFERERVEGSAPFLKD